MRETVRLAIQQRIATGASRGERFDEDEGTIFYTLWDKADDDILDAHIIPGADVVVTPQGLEDAAKAIADDLVGEGFASYDNCGSAGQEEWRAVARAAIEAAGIEVVDESTEIVSDRVVVELTRVIPNDDATTCTELHRGDRLSIKRAVTGHCDKEGLPPADPPHPECAGWPDVTTGDNDEGL